MTQGYHYTACGLDYVYLLNGYTMHETKHGPAISIKEARKLHEAIARDIVNSPRPIRGQEVRFLRSQLKLSQDGLARVLGHRRGTLARWEGEPDKPVPGAAGAALRMFYALKAENHEGAMRLVRLLEELDRLEHEIREFKHRAAFREAGDEWMREAA